MWRDEKEMMCDDLADCHLSSARSVLVFGGIGRDSLLKRYTSVGAFRD